jgi:hypothetical protein
MNKQIEELAKECTTQYRDGNGGFLDCVDTEKFAELIVQEAIAVVSKRYKGDYNREDMELLRCIEDLKKHFGVE